MKKDILFLFYEFFISTVKKDKREKICCNNELQSSAFLKLIYN